MAATVKQGSGRLDFAGSANEGVMKENKEETKQLVNTAKSSKAAKAKTPAKGAGKSLKDNLPKQEEFKPQTEVPEELMPEPNPAVTELLQTNEKAEKKQPKKKQETESLPLPMKKKKQTGKTISIYFSREAYEYIEKMKEEGYSPSNVVDWIVLKHIREEKNK